MTGRPRNRKLDTSETDDLVMAYKDATEESAQLTRDYHKALGEISARRHQPIFQLAQNGYTLVQISDMTGLTPGRIGHIISKVRRDRGL